ncbi:MAG TPA: hypothetical protein VJT73_00190 [Polyangiaceae bacterium]|nr:hypothetical protein [Polyangiaceae bacterium]
MDPRTARDELFAAPFDQFVETRARLAAELARAGQKDEGRALQKLRRPTLSAWATNQVVRRERAVVDAFCEASDRLRRSQGAMAAGASGRAEYQAAAEIYRHATAALADATRQVVGSSDGRGPDPHLVERVLSNFRTAATSDSRQAVLGGQLDRDVDPGEMSLAGLLGVTAVAVGDASAPPSSAPARAEKAEDPESMTRAAAEKAAEREREENARRLRAAKQEEAAAREAAERAAKAVTRARAARDEARDHLREAEAAVATAKEELNEAEKTLRDSERDEARAAKLVETALERRLALEPR